MNTSVETVIAMSGGVDSSVAALLRARDGGALAGITLRLADQDETAVGAGRCCAPRDVADARRVADALSIPHWVLDLRERFRKDVVEPFVREYLAGRTPVPCVACNDAVKFEDLLAHARALGAGSVTTGHYARIAQGPSGRLRLLRARDRARDQSYFLHGLGQAQLAAASFPLGEMTKAEVRDLAREAGLSTADKPDSREICFVPDGDAGRFVERRAAEMGLETRQGALVGADGAPQGRHPGVHHFTVGQRRGLGAHGRALHVVEIRAATGEIVVGGPEDLQFRSAVVPSFRWVSGEAPRGRIEASVQVRHGVRESPARLLPSEGGVLVEFLDSERAVAPGQYLVAYQGDECLGGGAIGSAERA